MMIQESKRQRRFYVFSINTIIVLALMTIFVFIPFSIVSLSIDEKFNNNIFSKFHLGSTIKGIEVKTYDRRDTGNVLHVKAK